MLKTGVKFATFSLLSYLRNIPKIVPKLMCKMRSAGFLMQAYGFSFYFSPARRNVFFMNDRIWIRETNNDVISSGMKSQFTTYRLNLFVKLTLGQKTHMIFLVEVSLFEDFEHRLMSYRPWQLAQIFIHSDSAIFNT